MREFLLAATAVLAITSSSHAMDMSAFQGKLYATAWFGGAVSVVDVAARKMTVEVPVGVQNHNIILNPDQTRAWVTNTNDGTVSVIDTATDKVIKTIAVGVGPRHTFFSPDGLQAYVTNEFDDTLSLIDTSSMTAVATVKVGMMPHFPMVVGDRIFVTDFGGRSVTVVNRTTRQVESTIRVGAGPLGAGATRDGTRAYVACHNANNVAVIDAKELRSSQKYQPSQDRSKSRSHPIRNSLMSRVTDAELCKRSIWRRTKS